MRCHPDTSTCGLGSNRIDTTLSYPGLAGCYILRPYAHQIWDKIHRWFDERIAALGVENCYFPLLITKKALETEASHVEGFAAEVRVQRQCLSLPAATASVCACTVDAAVICDT